MNRSIRWDYKTALVLAVLVMMIAKPGGQFAVADGVRFGPGDKIGALLEQPAETYTFIVRAETGRVDAVAAMLKSDGPNELTLIDGWAVDLPVSRAHALSQQPDVRQVWYLHPDEVTIHVNMIQMLGDSVYARQGPGVVNLSIGPPITSYSREPDPYHPIHVATLRAAEAGHILVVAAGNSGRSDGAHDGFINPWCLPKWVICVGATDGEGKRLWDRSSRGLPDHPDTWPDVVAPGVNRIVSRAGISEPKSPRQKQRDESNAEFRRLVPQEEWDSYTVVTGTSFAAPDVTWAASQILHFLSKSAEKRRGEIMDMLAGEPHELLTFPK